MTRRYHKYYVEVAKPPYRPAFTFTVYRRDVDRDQLSPSLVALYAVSAALNQQDAIAQVMCRAAGVVATIGE